MNIAVILAGGVGSRIGASVPKQFIEVFDKPIIAYTIDIFQQHALIDEIEVVCVESHIKLLKSVVEQYRLSKVNRIIAGGKDFQHSVINGVDNLRGVLSDEDIVLIHYAASPFVTDDIITDCIRVTTEKGNCVSATPCHLLYGSNDDGQKSSRWVDRDKIMQLNSPQCFKFGYVTQLYDEAIDRKLIDRVEPHTTSLMYAMGRTIYFAKGNQTNIKITTPEDIELFRGLILLKKMQVHV